MRSFLHDLRERIVATFQVSISSVKRYLVRYTVTRSAATMQQSYKQPQIRGEYEQELAAQVERMSDATLDAHVEEWERTTGMRPDRTTMCRALKRIGQSRKKDDWGNQAG